MGLSSVKEQQTGAKRRACLTNWKLNHQPRRAYNQNSYPVFIITELEKVRLYRRKLVYRIVWFFEGHPANAQTIKSDY